MSAQYALRPVELCDLPTLKRWRSLPSVQTHLRHPQTSWPDHLRWWWRIHHDPTCRVWAVVDPHDVLVGQAGLYYRMGPAAEVSILVFDKDAEDYAAERMVVEGPLADAAKAWGVKTLWAEVLTTAPLYRHHAFSLGKQVWADIYSTIYRWSIP